MSDNQSKESNLSLLSALALTFPVSLYGWYVMALGWGMLARPLSWPVLSIAQVAGLDVVRALLLYRYKAPDYTRKEIQVVAVTAFTYAFAHAALLIGGRFA